MMPGDTNRLVASTTSAPAGTRTFWPIAAIVPPRRTIVPFWMVRFVTVTIVALRIATTARPLAFAREAGRPMALLTEDGKVYEITGGLAADKNAKIVPHVTHTVEITGDVSEKDGKMTIAADSLKMISR